MERDQALKFMHDLLRLMVSKRGSDLFITSGFPPAIKIDGKITPQSNQTLTPQHTAELARSIMNDRQAAEFESTKECNFAISPSGIGRFRVNAFVQQGRIGCVLRTTRCVESPTRGAGAGFAPRWPSAERCRIGPAPATPAAPARAAWRR